MHMSLRSRNRSSNIEKSTTLNISPSKDNKAYYICGSVAIAILLIIIVWRMFAPADSTTVNVHELKENDILSAAHSIDGRSDISADYRSDAQLAEDKDIERERVVHKFLSEHHSQHPKALELKRKMSSFKFCIYVC